MAKPRSGNEFTTISIRWADKDRLRSLAKLVKKTRTGDMYESDAIVFNRIISGLYPTGSTPHQTYPTKNVLPSRDDDLQDSCVGAATQF